jgi:hypothetical protein
MRASQFKHFRTFVLILMMISGSLSAQVTTDWKYKIAITIDSTFIDDDLVNWTLVFDQSFSPVLTQVNGPLDADGAAPSLANGADLRFSTDTAGSTELAFDIRSWTTNNDPALAECEVAVKIPFVDKDDYTVIYMWWGNASASLYAVGDPFGQYNAYDNNTIACWTDGGGTSQRKSASYTSTGSGGVTQGGVTGKIGKATHYDGSDDHYALSGNPIGSKRAYTIEFLANSPYPSLDVGEVIYQEVPSSHSDPTIASLFNYNVGGTLSTFQAVIDDAVSGILEIVDGTPSASTWYHWACTFDGSDDAELFRNAVSKASNTQSIGALSNTDKSTIGAKYTGSYDEHYDGLLDELRISSIVRSDAWLKANYHNQFNSAGFLTFCSLPDNNFTLSDPTICTGETATITQSGSELGVDYQLRANTNDAPIGAPIAGTGNPITFDVTPAVTTTYNVLATNDVTACATELSDLSTVTLNALPDVAISYGTPNTPPSFTEQVAISTSAIEAWSVYSTDIDGDGHMDVLYASNDGKIAWYKNTDGAGTFGAEQTISTNVIVAFSVYAIDIDGDNDMDVLSASYRDNKIAWYENTDGAGTFGAQNVISTDANKATSVYSTDIDGDGDMDVLSSSFSDNKIAWYENDGTGNFGSQIVISTAASGATSVYATDMDGDGDMDVLSASWTDNKIAWYENTDGAGTFGAQNVISTVAMNASSVYATDMDGDGDMDVLSASNDDHKIAWYENTDGDGTFGAQQVISTAALSTRSVYATDLDGDGDMDVLSASYADNKIAWYENTDGDGTFGAQQVISTAALGAISVYATDIDGDGDMDVLSASFTDDKIAWYKNDLFDAQCAGDIQFNEEGGDATAWTWTSTNGAVSFDPNNTDQNPLVSNIADGDTVRVVITDGNGCTSRASVHMYINPLPDSSLDVSDPAVCLGQDATITVSASVVGVTYQLQLDSDDSPVGAPKAGTGGAIDFVLLTPTATGDYNVLSYFDATGCEVELVEKSTVFVNDLPGCPILWTGSKYAFGSGIDDAPGIADGNKGFVVQGPGAILPGDARVDYMTIEAGQDITVPSGISISVVDAINNEGTVTVKSSGSIVQESVADNNAGAGIYHIERDDIRDNTQFQIWSSPLQAAPLMGPGGVFDGANPCRTMVWNASSQRWKYDYVPNTVFDCGGGNITFSNRFLMFDDPADNLMDPARGYFIPGQVGTPLIVFSGKINNGPIVKPVFETVSTSPYTGDDWNLLGNPYPSALGITEWLDANAAILKTNSIYLWDDDGSGGSDYDEYDDYATVNQFGFVGGENGNGKYPTAPVGIATAQGFFIEASASGNVTFSNDMRITGENDKFYKTQPDDNPRLWINLNNQEGLQRQTLIGFASDATFQKDEKYDAPVLNANGILSIGSMLESTPMAIQAQPFLVEGDERFIPLHVFSKDGGKAILSFIRNEAMDGIEVYLKIPSQLAEIFIDDSEIDLDLNKGINDGYALIFRKGNVLSNSSINKNFGWKPIYTNDELMVEIIGSMEPDTRIEVLDLKGVVHETVNVTDRITRINTQNWAAGMYLVHLKSGSRDEVKRVVIR